MISHGVLFDVYRVLHPQLFEPHSNACVSRHGQADSKLAFRRFARRTGLLLLNVRSMIALPDEASVVEDPRVDLLTSSHRLQGIARSAEPQTLFVSLGFTHKVQPFLRDRATKLRLSANQGCFRFNTLALDIALQFDGVAVKRLATGHMTQDTPNSVEMATQAILAVSMRDERHATPSA
jgi:hypothetical protein